MEKMTRKTLLAVISTGEVDGCRVGPVKEMSRREWSSSGARASGMSRRDRSSWAQSHLSSLWLSDDGRWDGPSHPSVERHAQRLAKAGCGTQEGPARDFSFLNSIRDFPDSTCCALHPTVQRRGHT
ncbi:hypothetical protein ACLOJK_008451 [Asimina triloba]